ncbi:hypothetical protein GA0074696_6123 [Micromonospora purpureochromogenes]|uniref:Uncharacterized protein n=1 Tax=Micromonospora purpureochromogenes TaxID=47872 RepID=A0A1C5AJ66_9ACTN|nr:hypothetical protein GA0074696_6123 [Micromonospora purpureochromogenes]
MTSPHGSARPDISGRALPVSGQGAAYVTVIFS